MMRIRIWAVIFVFGALIASAHADAVLLLEESYGTFGHITSTGHAAVYLTNVCAASPTVLRRCVPGEGGVVINRNFRIADYDWLAIPLLPYLYAVDSLPEIPSSANAKSIEALRITYLRNHMQALEPKDAEGRSPSGEWMHLVGAAYDRRIYGFKLATTAAQDDEFIRRFNAQKNRSHFNLIYENCADFARVVLNSYFPHTIHRNFLLDVGITTPKQVARSVARYGKKHPELQYSSFVIPQVPGNLPRSGHVDGVLESVLTNKKFLVPLAILHPVVTGGMAAAYLADGRFNPKRHAVTFDIARAVQPPAAGPATSMAANSGSANGMSSTITSKRTE
jgi:hypothetical protein